MVKLGTEIKSSFLNYVFQEVHIWPTYLVTEYSCFCYSVVWKQMVLLIDMRKAEEKKKGEVSRGFQIKNVLI